MATLLTSVLDRTHPTATIIGGKQARPNQHPLSRMSNSANGILDNVESYATTASGIYIPKMKEVSFIDIVKSEIHVPTFENQFVLA